MTYRSGLAFYVALCVFCTSPSLRRVYPSRTEGRKNQIDCADMLLLFMTVFGLFIGSSDELQQERECYGSNFMIPFDYTPPLFSGKLYFTPTEGSRRVLIENKEAKDPRIKISSFTAVLKDLSEKDEGTFSVSFGDDDRTFDIIRLKIDECAAEITRYYGSEVTWDIPVRAEYMEFTQLNKKGLTQVVWNRTNPQTFQGPRGNMQGDRWEIKSVTPADSGFYNFRAKDNHLLRRKKLTVQEFILDFNKDVNKRLVINYPVSFSLGRVTFTPSGTSEVETLREDGSQDPNDNWVNGRFEARINANSDYIVIDPLESTDSGTFEVRDQNGYLVMYVDLRVNKIFPLSAVIGVAIGIISVVIICCYCMKKGHCKKSSSKRNELAPQSAAASATNYYDNSRPEVPPYSAVPSSALSYQPVNPCVSVEPATTSRGPQAAAIGGQEGATVVEGQGAAEAAPSFNIDCLSVDPAPTFELKGLNFLSASPLCSGPTSTDVYNSEKLNFL